MLNVDQPQWQQQLQEYQVRGVPQFFFIRSDRTVIKTLVGAVPQPILSSWFEKLLHPIS
jgi:thiol:disulfide interchange protein